MSQLYQMSLFDIVSSLKDQYLKTSKFLEVSLSQSAPQVQSSAFVPRREKKQYTLDQVFDSRWRMQVLYHAVW